MTRVAILPVPSETGKVAYLAISGDKHSQGSTAGEALDALAAQLDNEEAGTLVIVQTGRPDRFFSAQQRQRLEELMDRWRAARDAGGSLSADEQAELSALVDAELGASAARAAASADESGR